MRENNPRSRGKRAVTRQNATRSELRSDKRDYVLGNEGEKSSPEQSVSPVSDVETLRNVLETALAGLGAPVASTSLGSTIELYLAAKRPTWKPNSRRKNERLAADLAELYGSLGLHEISRSFGQTVLADAHAPSSKRERLALLAAVWRWSMAEGIVSRPVPWGRLKGPAAGKKDRWLDEKELSRFWSALDALEPHSIHPGSFRAIRLIALTGCRVSEICQLRSKHIDWTLGILRLPDSKTGPRDVPVATRVIAYLRALEPKSWVCPTADGKPVGQQRVWSDLARVCQRADLEGVSPHVLRHTWATHALLAGVPIEHVRIALGHATAYMTSRYGHLAARDVRISIDKATESVARGRLQ